MHLVNGHRRTSPNGFTAAICRNVLGYYNVTDDPTKGTCKNGDRVALAAVHYFETRARGLCRHGANIEGLARLLGGSHTMNERQEA
jgi:hypothetical protein